MNWTGGVTRCRAAFDVPVSREPAVFLSLVVSSPVPAARESRDRVRYTRASGSASLTAALSATAEPWERG